MANSSTKVAVAAVAIRRVQKIFRVTRVVSSGDWNDIVAGGAACKKL
jgi:hypothetical protein